MEEAAMSAKLPEDDGMNTLRTELHRIREMALSSEEKAKRMHALMTADFAAFRKFHASTETKASCKSDTGNPLAGSDMIPGKGDTNYEQEIRGHPTDPSILRPVKFLRRIAVRKPPMPRVAF
ncbi:MAG: hypothetical protein M1828_000555 [Chrysothrix sp. TS-e1954]|nr:MAG: hypothetical protein M1828_000555 [Chrysothrix sp. TS-e1954]